MVRQPVTSTDVKSVGYEETEPGKGLMEIEFRTGSIYLYHDVPATLYAEFMQAPSKGQFVNYVIKRSRLAYERVA